MLTRQLVTHNVTSPPSITALRKAHSITSSASELSTNQALNETHPLATSVRDIGVVKLLQYVKTKDKVLLVEPATRTVVDQIPS